MTMNTKIDYPEYFARFYDTIYNSLRTDDMEFYLKKISNCSGKILEIGVGTGRLFLKAIERKADIYGIDISKSMTDILKDKLTQVDQSRVEVQDVCCMNLPYRFDLIIAPFRVFSHLMSVEDQLMALRNIYYHLNNNGLFIFDLYVPNPKMIAEGLDHVIDFEGEYEKGKIIRRITSMKADIVNQISTAEMKFEWQENHSWREATWKMSMRFYFRFEVEHLIRLSPFKLLNVFGNFNEKPIDTDDSEMIVVCGKNIK